jgi:murein DD-endopeptidase MepM/ murein hydrolase activator NlpD
MRFNEFKLIEANSKDTIKRVQQILKDLGYNLGPTGIDGIVGPYTQSAIDAYMNKKGPEGQSAPNPAKSRSLNTPSKLPVNGQITSPFGYRTSVGKAHNHNGTDFAVPIGTPVRSPADGTIRSVGTNGGHAGTYVTLDAGGTVHKFFHLSKIMVKVGDQVAQGDTIALSGNTGYSTGPHLHWEKHIAGRAVDPMGNIG